MHVLVLHLCWAIAFFTLRLVLCMHLMQVSLYIVYTIEAYKIILI